MQKQFHIFIRYHFNGWCTASVLTHPEYAAYGPSLGPLKQELHDVLARQLALKKLSATGETHFEELKQKALRLELKAVQNDRLISVPIRFTIFARALDIDDYFEVIIPRIGVRFRIFGEENIIDWAEEMVRGHFHLKDVRMLLDYQYEKNERIETLDVVYHGPGRYKVKKEKIKKDQWEQYFQRKEPLAEIGTLLNTEAKEGRLKKAFFRDDLVQQMVGVLGGSQNRCLLLVGPSGVGKTAVFYEVVQRILQGNVSERLMEVPVWHITGGRIIAGMKYLGEWQERCKMVVDEIRGSRGILYVDSLMEVLTSGSQKSGLNVAQFLLPFMRSGELTVVAETTPDALAWAEQLNAPFVQAFRKLPIPGFPPDKSFQILEKSARRLNKEYKVEWESAAIHRALEILVRFGDADALPGSGLMLIEQMARLRPVSKGKYTIKPADAIKAFSTSSGFPIELIDPEKLLSPDAVRDFFLKRVKGQDHAMDLLTNLVMLIKASLNDPQKPLGSFLFMGPTGVGKTESALTLSEYLFNDRKRLIRIDMSEYAYPGSAARLIGGPDGQGELSRKVREQPFCIILLDEVEKADPAVFDVLLQVLGEGRLTDMTGQTVRFSHTIVIMTSNLGASHKSPVGFGGSDPGNLEKRYSEAAEKFFRPEFLNRIDFIVPFHQLEKGAIRDIAQRMLNRALEREGFIRRGITVKYGEEILDFLMKIGFNPKYGARPMKRAVDEHILIPLSRRLIRRKGFQGIHFELYLHDDRIAVLSPKGLEDGPIPLFVPLLLEHDNLWSRYLDEIRERLLDWEESQTLRELRESGKGELLDTLGELTQRLGELDEFSKREPSSFGEDALEELSKRSLELQKELKAFERALCLESLPGGDACVLFVKARTFHSGARRLQDALVQQYKQWAEKQSWQVEESAQSDGILLSIRGPKAETLLGVEQGIHRYREEAAGEEELSFEVEVTTASNPDGLVLQNMMAEDAPRRDYVRTPVSIWDAQSEFEMSISIEELSEQLDHFILSRLYVKIAQSKNST